MTPTNHNDDDELDALLSAALRARPAHVPDPDLAARSIRLARSRAAEPVLRLYRLARWTGAAAGVLIGAVLLLCATRAGLPLPGTTDAHENWPVAILAAAAVVACTVALSRAVGPPDLLLDRRTPVV